MAYGHRVTINQLYQELAHLLNRTASPIYVDSRVGDVRHSLADISLAKECLNYHPQFSMLEGLQKTATYYQELIKTQS